MLFSREELGRQLDAAWECGCKRCMARYDALCAKYARAHGERVSGHWLRGQHRDGKPVRTGRSAALAEGGLGAERAYRKIMGGKAR